MSPEAQRIAIAEACGWLHNVLRIDGITKEPTYGYWHKDGKGGGLPHYLSDLNAMHEAENEMTLDEQDKYAQTLTEMFHGPGWSFALIHASASQRAEAFLRTLKLWKD